ncbi:MAG TPA: hypothetical protein VJK72_04810 [Candidatus Nanoarchaeia archaeon]|nr:hypothetical protein [Candidatus Nanoarchaeia archaeon]
MGLYYTVLKGDEFVYHFYPSQIDFEQSAQRLARAGISVCASGELQMRPEAAACDPSRWTDELAAIRDSVSRANTSRHFDKVTLEKELQIARTTREKRWKQLGFNFE